MCKPGVGRTESSAPTEGCKKCGGAGRCRHRPLRKHYKGCNGRATARVAPTKALQGVRRGERNSPGTASPCQPPLGKGAKGTGEADCHDQFANWSRNDRVFTRGAGECPAGGQSRPPLRMRYCGCGGGGTMWASSPTGCNMRCRAELGGGVGNAGLTGGRILIQ